MPNPDSGPRTPFPTKLSETGLFDVGQQRSSRRSAIPTNRRLAPGVVPFSIVAEQWADHATAERFVALPGLSSIEVHRETVPIEGSMFSQQFMFPKDGVLVKTFSIEMESGNPGVAAATGNATAALQRPRVAWLQLPLERRTNRCLACRGGGEDRRLSVRDAKSPGGKRVQTWHYPSRNECMMCHNPWNEYRARLHPAAARHRRSDSAGWRK